MTDDAEAAAGRAAAVAATQATFCVTLVDEWARAGVRHAVIAPGSRSTPLALALAADDRIDVQVHHDERCAAFMALGIGLARGVPAVALCTSGTAATHFHAAVVEAHHARVPLLVCTADRPPELRDVGAPQAIDQDRLYGGAVRWFFDPGPPDDAMRSSWRSIASRAVVETQGHDPGPVHLNLPFREPLVGVAGELPPARDGDRDGRPWHETAPSPKPPDLHAELVQRLVGRSGVIVAGAGCGAAADVEELAARLGWPVLADPRSGLAGRPVVARADALLRVDALADELRPEVVLRLGAPPASKVVGTWLAGSGAFTIHVGDPADPARVAEVFVPGDAGSVVRALAGLAPSSAAPATGGLTERWRVLDDAADAAVAAVLADHPEPTEPGTARTLLAALPAGGQLVVASSMPVRDLEWFAVPRSDVVVRSNRGANGIDGTISTAIGVARATGAPTACLLGDVAFLHDSNALIGLTERGIDLTIVVLDNDGGGIFSFLPQASALGSDRFEQLFGTPHGVRPEALAAAHGIPAVEVTAAADLDAAIRSSVAAGAGVRIVVVRTNRPANVALHAELNAVVAPAVAALG